MNFIDKNKNGILVVSNIIAIIAIFLAIIGKPFVQQFANVDNINYSWYIVTRWMTFVPLLLISFVLYLERYRIFCYISLFFALLFNPIVIVNLTRDLWLFVDILVWIFIGLIFIRKKFLSNIHHPKSLVQTLTNFTEDKPLKFTTHIWDFGDLSKSVYKNFDGYMIAVKLQWDSIKKDLERLSPNLYTKVYNFLWETDPNVAVGWSSMIGLREHCDEGKNPFDFKNFNEIVSSFKKDIEIRKENNVLENIFIQERKKLGKKFMVELIKLKGQTFYTDTEKFSYAINTIFSQMGDESKQQFPNITVEVMGDSTKEFIELKIIQIDSESGSNAEVMLKEINDGDFASIKANLLNLCDWSIESSNGSSSYRVNYLKSNNIEDIEELNYKPLGFTHVLRFYNK